MSFSRIAAWWQRSLKQRPALTNTIVYGIFYSAAETSQQTFNKYYTVEKPDYDFASAARVVGTGCAVYPVTLSYWYRYLDMKFPGAAAKQVMTKVCADQFIMTPILLFAFFTLLAYLENRKDLFEEIREKYWKAFMMNQAFWIPGQIINFAFMPPYLRVVYVATVSFVWINVLCFIKRQKLPSKEMKDLIKEI